MVVLLRRTGFTSAMTSLDAAWVAANFAEAEAAPFSSDDLVELTGYLTPRDVEWGEVLFHEGEDPKGVWILQAGAIELIYGTGENRALIRMINPGEAVGDLQILREAASPFKARAAEPSACLFIDRDAFSALLAGSPSISRRWMAKLALQVCKNHNRIVALLTTALRDRLAQFLLHENVDGLFRHSQGTIAAMLGVHRSSINQILGDFEALGLVKVTYRCIEILDRDGLSRMANGHFVAS
jgi:CRP/FNR family transcriptional regulator, cAMP and macrophage regulator